MQEDEVKAPYSPTTLEVVPPTKHHGPYIIAKAGQTVCDFYVMRSTPEGDAKPVWFLPDEAEGNARRMVACWNAFERRGIKDPEGFMRAMQNFAKVACEVLDEHGRIEGDSAIHKVLQGLLSQMEGKPE